MTTNQYPRLCGGTFFTLLLQARRPRTKAREHRKGERDGLSETDVLIRLIKIMNPDFVNPTRSTSNTFKTNTSEYKSCKISDGTYLQLSNTCAFERRIAESYPAPLQSMGEFVGDVIDVGTSAEKEIQLVKALLELIDSDSSIDDEQEFYICADGSTMNKAALRSATEICLPSFLLGIWHFVLANRKDNTVGKETFDKWCPTNGGKPRKYVGDLGHRIDRQIQIIPVTLSESIEKDDDVPYVHVEDEPHTEEPPKEPIVNQIINTPAVFINHGANGIQIMNNGTLNIDRGSKS